MIAAIAMASAAMVSQAAYAGDISTPTTPVELVDGSAFFGQHFNGGHQNDTFADNYSFSLTGSAFVQGDVFSSSGNANNGLNITGLDLFDSNGLVGTGHLVSTGAKDEWQLDSTGPLLAGNYYLQVRGSVVSNASGKYNSSVTVSPVPEPATYGMMLGGLALVGAIAARRSKKQVQAA
ncbi:PEP-CTERM sorting domain-containing protein [Oxalobacteraceae bacterium]|nr:PEP-CTERM sorting domain-containing protein [Oxalobacteraceae bacterium]